jgi:hypothetical protein
MTEIAERSCPFSIPLNGRAPFEQGRRDSDVQFIDEARMKILLDSFRSAANAHIHSVGCVARPVRRLVNSGIGKMKDSSDCLKVISLCY